MPWIITETTARHLAVRCIPLKGGARALIHRGRPLPLDLGIRYVAVNRGGRIEEMARSPRWPSHNPEDTDRMELIVNRVVLDLARRRGDLDLGGVRRMIIRYGKQYQLLVPIAGGHVSVGVELTADVERWPGRCRRRSLKARHAPAPGGA